ncbi:P97 family adhesin [Mesomycoplasma ovipneumoniae]|uniref:P97 family adhesin n=1 Tax=Mesomycoplasma ovipneumoniae TaxID=29562 RepID=UPI00311B0E83
MNQEHGKANAALRKKRLILTIGLSLIASGLIIGIPVGLVSNLSVTKDPLFDVQKQANSISSISLKSDIVENNADYFSLKSKLFESDGTKKSGINFTDFFDFYAENSNSNFEIVDFQNDFQWQKFKLNITDIEALDQEQSFKIYWRVLQNLDDGKVANSDLHSATVAYNRLSSLSNSSLSNFTSLAKAELSKLRPYLISEFDKSPTRQIAKLTTVSEFLTKVNSAKSALEASKIISQYFNLESTITNLLRNKINKFVDDDNFAKNKYSIELIQEPVLKNAYLSKTPLKNIYRAYFSAKFSDDFSKHNNQDLKTSPNFNFAVDLDFSDTFLDGSLANDIELSPFSDSDFTNFSDIHEQSSQKITSWELLNYLKNQVFPSYEEKQAFYKNLLNQISNVPLLSKIKLKNYISRLRNSDLFSKIKIDFNVNPEMTQFAYQNNKVVTQFHGNIEIYNEKDEIIAQKPFVQNVGDYSVLVKNIPDLSSKVKAVNFEFNQKDAQISERNPIPKEEIQKLVTSGDFTRLKSILENPHYYGAKFDEEKLKLLVQKYDLIPVDELISRSRWTFTYPEEVAGIVNILSPVFPSQEEMLRFYATLAKNDTTFVAKYFFDWLKGLKLIDPAQTWPENLDNLNLFKELANIKIENKTGFNNFLLEKDKKEKKDIWLISINNNYWAEKGRMPYSFYLHPRLKNIIDLMVQNQQNTINIDYYVDQIKSESSKIQEIDPTIGDKYRSPIKTLTDFIVAFYQNVYSNKTGLLSEPLGDNFDYKINFEITSPIATATQFEDDGFSARSTFSSFNHAAQSQSASTPQSRGSESEPTTKVEPDPKVNLKYWYEVGPVDRNGKIISVIYKTQPRQIEISTNKDGIIIPEEVEKLNNFVDNFRTTTLPTYLDNNDFNDLWTNINRLVGDKEDYVDITELIKKFPMYSYFSLHYPEFGLAVKKDAVKKPAEALEPVATEPASTESPTPVQTPTAETATESLAPTPPTPAPVSPPAEPAAPAESTPAPAPEPAPKATEPAAQTPNSTGKLAGVYENYPGTDTIKVLHFYVYNKKNPNEFSTKKLKFFVYKTDKSLLNS